MAEPLAIVPAVSVRAGEVVVVRGNAYEPVEDAGGAPFAPDEFADVFLKEFPAVLFFDIDAIEGKGAQFDAISSLDGIKPDVWWDGGAQDHTDVVNIITAGADRAVVSTRRLAGLREWRRACELTDNLAFEIVTKGPEVQAKARDFRGRSAAQVAAAAAQAGAERFILIDANRPLGAPVDWAEVARVAPPGKELFIGGGIDASSARALVPPEGVVLSGVVVDLISVLTPFL